MSVADAIVYALLAVGVAVEVIACLGVAAMRGVHDRLHYLAPSTLGALPIAAAVWVREGPSMIALKVTLLALFIVASSPVVTHVTSRAARINERGDWRSAPEEKLEVEGG